jgi:predicted ABC-type ATPase
MTSNPHSSEYEPGRRLQGIADELVAAGLSVQLHRTRAGLDLTAALHRPGLRETDVLIDEDGYTELRYWADQAATPAQVAGSIVHALGVVCGIHAAQTPPEPERTPPRAEGSLPLHLPDPAIRTITGYDNAVTERAGDGGMAGAKDAPTEQQYSADSVRQRWPDRADPELVKRMENLAHGHPSSPYNADHTRKPPVPDTTRNELPLPGDPDYRPDTPTTHESSRGPGADRQATLASTDADLGLPTATSDTRPQDAPPDLERLTDAEYADHIHDVRDQLAQARLDGLATNEKYTTDTRGEVWLEEREAFHNAIVDHLYGRSVSVPTEYKAIMAGGLPGAGKSTVLEKHAGIDRSRFFTINPDDIKEEMARRGLVPAVEGLSPMEASDLVHEESSHIAKRLARRAQVEGKNVIWDITMSSRTSTEQRIEGLRSSGYTYIEGIFVDISLEISQTRSEARHRTGYEEYLAGKGEGGRFVPEELIGENADPVWGSVNRKTFEAVKHRFERWSVYDNSIDGHAPTLAESSAIEESRI